MTELESNLTYGDRRSDVQDLLNKRQRGLKHYNFRFERSVIKSKNHC